MKGVAETVGEGAGGREDSVTTTTCSGGACGAMRNGVAVGAGVGVGDGVGAGVATGRTGVGLAAAMGRAGGLTRSNFFHVLHE